MPPLPDATFADDVQPPDLPALTRAATELVRLDEEVASLENTLAAAKKRRHDYASRVLPEMLASAGADRVGLPDSSADVVLEEIVHASIKKEWDEDRRAAAFRHLDECGAGDLIQATVSVAFPKEMRDTARTVAMLVQRWLDTRSLGLVVREDVTVNWSTLTSWVREELSSPPDPEHSNRRPVNLDLIGATVTRLARVVQRREPAPRRTRR